MASIIYNSALYDMLTGAVDCDTDTFKVMAVAAAYTEDKDTHLKRSSITNEVTGTGYTAGGNAVTVTVTKDTVNDRIDVSLGGTTWPTATFTARKFVYYKARGGASSADELVAVVDNGTDVTATGATFTLTASTLRVANP